MTIVTRKPTGKPSWPITLIAGRQGTGKSWAAAEASASELIGRTFWIGVGEDDPDEYGIIPGARFEIVEHDGTYRGILTAITEAAAEPIVDGKPNLIVLDSGSRLWSLLADNAQATANKRAIAKALKYKRSAPTDDSTISMDLWNIAASRWEHIMQALRGHRGPSIITARIEQVAIVNDAGEPTKEKTWKIYGHKTLPYDVRAIIELPERGEAWISKLTTARRPLKARTRWDAFTIEALWKRLGLDEGAGERVHAETVTTADEVAEPVDEGERDWIAEADAAATSKDAARIEAAAAVVMGPDHELVAAIHQIVVDKQGGPADGE